MSTAPCPNCGLGIPIKAPECPRCGVVFAKMRANYEAKVQQAERDRTREQKKQQYLTEDIETKRARERDAERRLGPVCDEIVAKQPKRIAFNYTTWLILGCFFTILGRVLFGLSFGWELPVLAWLLATALTWIVAVIQKTADAST